MDLRSKRVNDSAFLHLRDADDELMYEGESRDDSARVGIHLYSPGSKAYQKAQAHQNNKMMDKIKAKGKVKESADEKAESQADFLVACTMGFQNIERDQLQGEALFRAVYTDLTIGFVATQAQGFLNDWANFTPSATNRSDDTSATTPG